MVSYAYPFNTPNTTFTHSMAGYLKTIINMIPDSNLMLGQCHQWSPMSAVVFKLGCTNEIA